MPVRKRSGGWQVEVNLAAALPGYKRIRAQVGTSEADARRLEMVILNALYTYGKYPVVEGDKPLALTVIKRRTGTLRQAADLALRNHWWGTTYYRSVAYVLPLLVGFLEDRGRLDIDDITSEDIDALVDWYAGRGNSSTSVNKAISMLSVVGKRAMRRDPPLATKMIPLERQKDRRVEKWWLRPEDFERLTAWLVDECGDVLFADFISLYVLQGLRVDENLVLATRHFSGLDGDRPNLKVPGTKTAGAEATIPVFAETLPIVMRCVERQRQRGWTTFFPYTYRQASKQWNECRTYLGVRDIESSTLRALRRTFAYYANTRGVTTRTLQKLLRHGTITTTEGYLRLTGTDEAEQARAVMDKQADNIKEAIAAFRATGATPKEVAEFTKEMMR